MSLQGDLPSLAKFRKDCPERVDGQLRGMSGGLGQTSDRLGEVLPADGFGLVRRLASRQLGHHRGAGHGRHASFGAKSDLGDATGLHLDREFQDVAADRIFHPHLRVRAAQLPGISGVLKMVEELRRVHGCGLICESFLPLGLPPRAAKQSRGSGRAAL